MPHESKNKMGEIEIHHHALQRSSERGASVEEIMETVKNGEEFPAKYDRTGFRKNFLFDSIWNGKHYSTKQIECYCVIENNHWLVITILVKFY